MFVLDPNAIHVNTDAEIVAIAEKVLPVNTDLLVIEDSAAGNAKKKVQIGNLPAGGGGGADPNAIHDNIAGEIVLIGEKVVPVAADLVIIEDSADANNKKRVQVGNLPGGTDGAAIHDNVAGEIHAIASKAVPVAADEVVIEDSAAAWAKKRMSLSTIPIANGADGTAIHDDTAGEIHAIASKAVPVAADELVIEDSAAAWAKKRIAISALPSGGGGLGYALNVITTSYNPVDSETVHFSNIPLAPNATAANRKLYIPIAGTITACDIMVWANNAVGTNEDWSLYLRLNDTTDTLIATLALATVARHFVNLSLSIAVAAGDYICIKSVEPAWATNPSSVVIGGCIYIE